MELNEKTIRNIKTLKRKHKFVPEKFILSYKYFAAQLISYLFPKVYGSKELKQVVEQCLSDDQNPDNPFLRDLIPSDSWSHKIIRSEAILSRISIPTDQERKDLLLFLLFDKYPEDLLVSESNLKKRIKRTSWELIRTQRDQVGSFCPVCVVWIFPEERDQPFSLQYWNDSRIIDSSIQISSECFPNENNFIIRLGECEDKRYKEMAFFLKSLMNRNPVELNEVVERFHIPLRSEDARDMKMLELSRLLAQKEKEIIDFKTIIESGMPKRCDSTILEILELL